MNDSTIKTSDRFYSAYSPKQKVRLDVSGESRTKQSFKAECDINNILARFKKTGVIDFVQKMEPQYGDVTAIEFQEAQFKIAAANGLFAAMPGHLRATFDNSPAKFLAFVQDPTNRAKAEALGLLKPKNEAVVKTAPETGLSSTQANPTAAGATPPPASTASPA